MENQNPPKIPKYLFLFLSLVVLILIGEGVYYFYLKDFGVFLSKKPQGLSSQRIDKPTKTVSPVESNESDLQVERYFEGAHCYEEINGEKRLLVIEGSIDTIYSEEKIVIVKHKDVREEVQHTDSDLVYLVGASGLSDREEVSFSAMEVGDFVSYNPVDEAVNRTQAIWLVQKQ